MSEMNLGFLASHRGSNMQAVVDACKSGRLGAKPCVVISNNSQSGAIERANREGIPHFHLSTQTHPDPDQLDMAICDVLNQHNVGLVVLAGYMKKIGPKTLKVYKDRIVNIHPALLPKYGGRGMYGMHVHKAVIAAGEQETGVTVHLVDGSYDTGPVLAQSRVPVLADDTPKTLASRVLVEEHRFLVETLGCIISGEIPLSKR